MLPLRTVLTFYVVALIATVAAVIAEPHSSVRLLILMVLVVGFLGVAALVLAFSGLFMVSMVARRVGFGIFQYIQVRAIRWQGHGASGASDPGNLRVDPEKLRLLCPEVYEPSRGFGAWVDGRIGNRAALRFLVNDQLTHGDSRAAVVVSLAPLIVAAYADDLDCVTMLRFPDEFVERYRLHLFSRLLTVNRFFVGGPTAPDLEFGPLKLSDHTNVQPFIADFLSSDEERLRERKQRISQQEWKRATSLGRRALELRGLRARDGRPTVCMSPAE